MSAVEKGKKGRQTLSVVEYLDLRDEERLKETHWLDFEGYEDASVSPSAFLSLKAPKSLWDEDEAAKVYPVKTWREDAGGQRAEALRRFVHFSEHGLVSSVYALSAPTDYWTDEERFLRSKTALKCLTQRKGRDVVETGLRHACVSKPDEPVLANLRFLLSQIP